jgi:hypothetical protein
MLDQIDNHLEKMLSLFTQGEYFSYLRDAKDKYTSLTGKLDEDVSEFESRMNCFNDWYLFQFKDSQGKKLIENYIKKEKLGDDVSSSFLNLNHSLFEFSKVNMKNQIVLFDFLHDQKIILAKDQTHIGLVEDDIFIGRTINYGHENYLLRGVCTLPDSIRSSLSKECKKVRKLNSYEEEQKFLMNLESLKTKSMHYSHIEPSKIFVFN